MFLLVGAVDAVSHRRTYGGAGVGGENIVADTERMCNRTEVLAATFGLSENCLLTTI